MTDSPPCRIEVDPQLVGKFSNCGIFLKILLTFILNIMIKSKNRLPGIGNIDRAD